MTYCIYTTTNADGYFYSGRGKTATVRRGVYTGSGVFYTEFRRLHPVGWSTNVLVDGLTFSEAVVAERSVISDEFLSSPLCLNLMGANGSNAEAHQRFKALCPEYHYALWKNAVDEVCTMFELEVPSSISDGNAVLLSVGGRWSCYTIEQQ